jgi:hypothetical protein
MNDTIALRPLRNVFLSAEYRDRENTITIRDADIDRIAASVFATIDADESLHGFRPAIAKHFAAAQTDWLTGSGSSEELEAAQETFTHQLGLSLASAYVIAGAPDLPVAFVTASEPSPLPSPPTLAALRKWTCEWQVQANLRAYDIDESNIGAPLPSRPAADDATAFELALLRFQRAAAAGEDLHPYAESLASTPLDNPGFAPYEGALTGLGELTVTLDVLDSLDIWCAVTRNSGPDVNPAFIYRTVGSLRVAPPFIDRGEIDLPAASGLSSSSLEEYLASAGSELLPGDPAARITINYATSSRIPILLIVAERFEAHAVAEAIELWLTANVSEPVEGAALEFAMQGPALAVTLRLPLAAIGA